MISFCRRSEKTWPACGRLWGGSYSPSYVENNALHALLAAALLYYNILLMHGSALCMDGEAYIFAAPSGTGKSTHARLWREVFGDRVWMINDDKPLVRVEEERAFVFGSPWCGKHKLGCNGSARLKAVVELTTDRNKHGHVEISRVQVSEKLLKMDQPLSRLWINGALGSVPELL